MMGSFSFLLYHIVNISTILNFKITGYNFEKRRAVAAIIDYAPFVSVARMIAPTTVFASFPFPPDMEIPPITAAAIAFIS